MGDVGSKTTSRWRRIREVTREVRATELQWSDLLAEPFLARYASLPQDADEQPHSNVAHMQIR